ncbi:unnamed protein product [Urochloa humidicola]
MALRQRRGFPDGGGDGDGLDRISGLLQVLVRLGCAREAARTSVLARRWRELPIRLPEYTFRGMDPESVEAALARPPLPSATVEIEADLDSAAIGRVSSLLRAAARLQPEKFSARLYSYNQVDEAVEFPCFDRTISLNLRLYGATFMPPPTGEFTRLESLELDTSQDYALAAMLPCCPRLLVLRIRFFSGLKVLTVHSAFALEAP